MCKYSNLIQLDLSKVWQVNEVFWEPLSQLQKLEGLVVSLYSMKAEAVQFAARMSKLSPLHNGRIEFSLQNISGYKLPQAESVLAFA